MHKTLINNKKVNLILGIIIGLTFFVALAVFARNFIYDNSPNNDSKNEMASTSQTVTETPVKSKSKIDIAIEKCNDLPNAFEKMCLIKLVDIVAKEREWKQRKIEEMDLNQYEINVEDKNKITIWRKNFIDDRNTWCSAENAFLNQNADSIARCKIDTEKRAIEALNTLYYNVITDQSVGVTKPIKDFEPSEVELDKFIKTFGDFYAN